MVPGTYTVGYVSGNFTAEFVASLLDLWERELPSSREKLRPGVARRGVKGLYVPLNRNAVVEHFLKGDSEWLWFLDTDVSFAPDLIDYLLAVADPEKRPIVAAIYFVQLPGAPANTWWPAWHPAEDAPVPDRIDLGSLYELGHVGMGCTLIHRTVLERMREKYDADPWHWFSHDIAEGPDGLERAGEDVTFCRRARAAGFSVWGLALPVDHHKTVPITWDTYRASQAYMAALQQQAT
jgi:hypothetical protein